MRENRFKQIFHDTLNPICHGFDVESTSHYVYHFHMCSGGRHTLLSIIKNMDYRSPGVSETVLMKTILFIIFFTDANTNTEILNATVKYILTSKRFHESLFHSQLKILLVFLSFI